MLKNTLLLALFFTCIIKAQVGIGTTAPKSSLDIEVLDSSNPSNTDGLLIPRIDIFPVVNPTADQQGMLVHLTTTSGGNSTGFYYWDNTVTTWVNISGVVKTYLEDADADVNGQVLNTDIQNVIRPNTGKGQQF